MRWTLDRTDAISIGIGAALGLVFLLVVGAFMLGSCAAQAQDGSPPAEPTVSWAQVGTAAAAIVGTFATALAGGGIGARRSATPPQDLAPLIARLEERDQRRDERDLKFGEVLGRLDERTKVATREIRRIRETQHDHANMLTELAASAGIPRPKVARPDPDVDDG